MELLRLNHEGAKGTKKVGPEHSSSASDFVLCAVRIKWLRHFGGFVIDLCQVKEEIGRVPELHR
jgi:hypothetical protein